MAIKITWIKPAWIILGATITGVLVFSYLGAWQLQREEFKKQILLENERRKNSAPINLKLPIEDPDALRFQRVRLQGQFISEKQFVLDNKMHQHRVGYNVFTPFALKGSDTVVLIDRGWVPMGSTRDELPTITIDKNSRSIIGTVYVPFSEPFRLGDIDSGESSWPRLIQFLDFVEMEKRLELQLLHVTVRMEPNQSDGYVTEWPLFAFTPNRHFGYAVQWFAFTLTVLSFFLYFHIKIYKQKTS